MVVNHTRHKNDVVVVGRLGVHYYKKMISKYIYMITLRLIPCFGRYVYIYIYIYIYIYEVEVGRVCDTNIQSNLVFYIRELYGGVCVCAVSLGDSFLDIKR